MGLKSQLRNEFPPRWWASRLWWREGLVEMGRGLLLLVAPCLSLRRVLRAAGSRGDPVRLIVYDRVAECALACAVIHLMALVGIVVIAGTGMLDVTGVSMAVFATIAVWAVANLVTGSWVLAILWRSRARRRSEWLLVDFVELKAPLYGRPPDTIEEYEASRLRANLGYE